MTQPQVTAAQALVKADLKSGVLVAAGGDWAGIFSRAACRATHRHRRLPFVGHFPLRHGQSFGRDRIHQHGHPAKKAGRRHGFEPCDHLKRAICCRNCNFIRTTASNCRSRCWPDCPWPSSSSSLKWVSNNMHCLTGARIVPIRSAWTGKTS